MSQCRIVCNTDQEDQEEESQDDSYLQVTDDDGEEGETLLVTVRWPPTMAIKTGAGDLIQQKFYNCTQVSAFNKQEVIPPHEDITLENLVSHLMSAQHSSRYLSVTNIFFKQDDVETLKSPFDW